MDFGNLSPGVILVTVVGLALAPFVAVMVTSFTKIVVVLSLLHNALGLQQVPPNVVVGDRLARCVLAQAMEAAAT